LQLNRKGGPNPPKDRYPRPRNQFGQFANKFEREHGLVVVDAAVVERQVIARAPHVLPVAPPLPAIAAPIVSVILNPEPYVQTSTEPCEWYEGIPVYSGGALLEHEKMLVDRTEGTRKDQGTHLLTGTAIAKKDYGHFSSGSTSGKFKAGENRGYYGSGVLKNGCFLGFSASCHARYLKSTQLYESVTTQYDIAKYGSKDFLSWILSDVGPHRMLFEHTPRSEWRFVKSEALNKIIGFTIPQALLEHPELKHLVYNLFIMSRVPSEYDFMVTGMTKLLELPEFQKMDSVLAKGYAYVLAVHIAPQPELPTWVVRGGVWQGSHQCLSESHGPIDVRRFSLGQPMFDKGVKDYGYTSKMWHMSNYTYGKHRTGNFMFQSYGKVVKSGSFSTASVIDSEGIGKLVEAWVAYIDKRYESTPDDK